MFDLLIKNGTIVTSKDTFAGNIYVSGEKIAMITAPDHIEEAAEVVDAAGKHIFAGFIDTHIHSRDGGATYKEDFWHSSRAAAVGGITTLLEMPNAVPAVATVENFYEQQKNLASKAYIDFGMWALCVGDLNNQELVKLADLGVVGFKFFWGYAIRKDNYNLIYNPKADDDNIIPPLSDGEVFKIFREVAKTGKEIAIHAENASLIKTLTSEINPDDYKNPYEALLDQRPIVAEVTTTQTAIRFAQETNTKLHILHISAGETVDLIREAQKKGVPVTGETCPHYLLLTNERYEEVGNLMKGYPPVRYKEDQKALWKGLQDGTLNHICSDHAPHTKEEKQGTLSAIPAGMCSVESMVPLTITAVNDGQLSMNELAAYLSENPARHYGIYPNKGSLMVGTDADITIVDFNKSGKVEAEKLHSVSKITAFDGFELSGMPVMTISRGKIIVKDGELTTEESGGQFIEAK